MSPKANMYRITRESGKLFEKYGQTEREVSYYAERMNFTSLSYFSRYCTKHLGQSPSEYRQSLQPK